MFSIDLTEDQIALIIAALDMMADCDEEQGHTENAQDVRPLADHLRRKLHTI